jgi:U3 small nucleolar RNA-associated protein 18
MSDNIMSDDDALSDAEAEFDSLPSAAPLSKLLRDADSLVRSAGPGMGRKRKLRPETISIQRVKDIDGTQPSSTTSLSFHPQLPLLLSSGPSSTLYLHHITASPPAPAPNPLLTSMHIRGAALATTAFHPNDSRIFLSGRRRFFHVWDLHTGRVEKITQIYGQQHEQKNMERLKLSPDGQHIALLSGSTKGGGVINILSALTLQFVAQVRVESRGGIADFAWWCDGGGLCIAAKNGEVTEWDVRRRVVAARWQDEGAVGSTVLALGGRHEIGNSTIGRDRWIAIGSSSGIVNIYDRRVWLAPSGSTAGGADVAPQSIPTTPKPTKVLDHLTTPTSHLAFAPDGQMLIMASQWKRDALRLVHLPSCTVFANWPTLGTPLGRITGVAITDGRIVEAGGERHVAIKGTQDGGGDVRYLMAVANEAGKIRLWEIR